MAVVSPGGPVAKDRLDAGCRVLRSWGLDVVLGAHAADVHPRFGYMAGPDSARAADLQEAWLAADVAGVLCARGGYGSQRIADLLDWDAMRSVPPKVFGGYSDVTSLHAAFGTRLGVATLHCPMVGTESFLDDARSALLLRRMLFEPASELTLSSPGAVGLVPGAARGVTVGGCASVLAAELGSPTAWPGAGGGILLLEDTDEDLYRLDRVFTHLLRSGWLEGVAGIALGSWQGCEDGVHDLALDRFGGLGVPIVGELGFGHGPGAITVPLGVPATLDAAAAALTLEIPALA